MRETKYTARFNRDYRREKSGVLGKKLDTLLMDAVNRLAADLPLPERLRDHALAGEWQDQRRPGWVLGSLPVLMQHDHRERGRR